MLPGNFNLLRWLKLCLASIGLACLIVSPTHAVVPAGSYILNSSVYKSNEKINISSGTIRDLNAVAVTVSSSIFVGDGTSFKKGVFYGGGGSVVSTILELRNSGTSGAGTGSRLYFTEGSSGQFEQGSFEFVDEAAAGIGETFNLYLTPNGSPASRFRALKLTSSSAFGPPEYWFGSANAGTAIFDFKSTNPAASNNTVIMRVSGNGTNHVGDILQLYARDNTTQRLRVSEGGSMVLNGSHTIEGAGGLGVTYGAVMGSATISNLTSGQCVQAGTGGLLTVSGAPCGTGGGGGASSLEVLAGVVRTSPTVTVGFPTPQFKGSVTGSSMTVTLDASSVTLQGNTNVALLNSTQTWTGGNTYIATSTFVNIVAASTITLSGQMKFTNRNGILLAPDGTKLLSMPDNQTMYFGNGSALNPTAGGTFNACGGTGCMAGVTTENFSSCWGNSCMANGALSGTQNNCQGYACQANRTSANYDACIGGSCQLTVAGDNNFCGGSVCQAGLTTGGNNDCTGHQCQYQLKDGSGNSAGGFQAGGGTEPITMSNVGGSNNTHYGKNSGQSVSSSTVISNSFSYGANAIVGCKDCGVLGNPLIPMYVGIGTTTPRANFTVAGASGTYVSYGADVGSMTVRNLASGQCVQTGAGGALTVTGSACGAGGGSGFSIYPATATAGFPLGLTASTATINDLTVTTLTVVGSGGGGGAFAPNEGTAPTGVASVDILWADSTAHTFKFNPNNSSTYTVVGTSNPIVSGNCAQFSGNGTLLDSGVTCNSGSALLTSINTWTQDNNFTGTFQASSIRISSTGSSLVLGYPAPSYTVSFNPTTARAYLIPDAGADASFMLTKGTQTLSGGTLTVASSVTVTGAGGIGATYGVVAGSLTASNLASGQCVQTGAGGLLTVTGSACGSGGGGTPGLPFNSVQFNNAGAFGGSANFNWSGTSVTVSGQVLASTISVFVDATASLNTTKGAIDIYNGQAPVAGTAILFSAGSNQQADQFIIQDQKPLNLTRYGLNFGALQAGLASNPSKIFSNQSVQSYIDWWNSGQMEIKTATSGNGGKEITFYPQQVEVLRVSNTAGVVVKSSMTVPTVSYGLSSVTNNYTASSTSTVILANAATASLTVTLPTAVGVPGLVYRIKRLNSGANTVTIATTSAQTIDGATTQVLTTQYTSVDIVSDGANWNLL